MIYNVTIRYTDGTPDATASVSLIQDTAGNLYLAPEYSNTPDVATLGAAPIASITINSINSDPSWFIVDRVATDFLCFGHRYADFDANERGAGRAAAPGRSGRDHGSRSAAAALDRHGLSALGRLGT